MSRDRFLLFKEYRCLGVKFHRTLFQGEINPPPLTVHWINYSFCKKGSYVLSFYRCLSPPFLDCHSHLSGRAPVVLLFETKINEVYTGSKLILEISVLPKKQCYLQKEEVGTTWSEICVISLPDSTNIKSSLVSLGQNKVNRSFVNVLHQTLSP